MIAAISARKSPDQNAALRRVEEPALHGKLRCAQCRRHETVLEVWRNSDREITLRSFADLSGTEKAAIMSTSLSGAFKEFNEVWTSQQKVKAFCGPRCFDAWIAKVVAQGDQHGQTR